MSPEQARALRAPFPAEQVGKLPRKGITLDYVGHGAVTSRLLEVDPEWNWEPVATDTQGFPVFDTSASGDYIGLWIKLTVGGVTRLGYGSVPPQTQDAAKQLIGDALRNAAMRFGVALDLWIKGHVPEDDERNVPDGPRASGRARQEQQDGPVTEDMVNKFYLTAATAGFDESDVVLLVEAATGGRKGDPLQMLQSEWPALRDEFRKAKERRLAAPPFSGEGGPPDQAESRDRATGTHPGPEGAPPAPEPEPATSQGGKAGRARVGSRAKEEAGDGAVD